MSKTFFFSIYKAGSTGWQNITAKTAALKKVFEVIQPNHKPFDIFNSDTLPL